MSTLLASPDTSTYDVVTGAQEASTDIEKERAAAKIAWIEDRSDTRVSGLLGERGNGKNRHDFLVAFQMLQLAVYPSAGNHNLAIDVDEQIRTIDACLESFERSSAETTPARVAAQNWERIGKIGSYVRNSLSF